MKELTKTSTEHVVITNDDSVHKMEKIPEPQFDMKFVEYDDKLIAHLKKLIRGSFEYVYLMQYIKKYIQADSCIFHKNYSVRNGLSIEIHHEPFTITDIIKTVCEKQLKFNNFFTERTICNDVMESHYSLEVGLVPLCPTCHELVGSGKLKIPIKSILSDGWKVWYQKNSTYADDLVEEKYQDAIQREKNETVNNVYPEIVSKKQQLINVVEFKQIGEKECRKLLIEDKINNLGVIE